jgi:hypothetical protein
MLYELPKSARIQASNHDARLFITTMYMLYGNNTSSKTEMKVQLLGAAFMASLSCHSLRTLVEWHRGKSQTIQRRKYTRRFINYARISESLFLHVLERLALSTTILYLNLTV